MSKVGYIIEHKTKHTVFNGYRRLWQAKQALSDLCAPGLYRIIAINEYQGYLFEGPHLYYIDFDGVNYRRYKRE